MVRIEDFQADDRFYVDAWNLKRIMVMPVRNYSVCKIRIGDIIRELEGNIYRLEDTDVYRYLDGSESSKAVYREYCLTNGGANSNRREDSYNTLIKELSKKGYDIKKGAIFVNQYNMVQEGQHRCCVLLYLYGPEKMIDVVKLHYGGLRIRQRVRYLKWRVAQLIK